MLLGIEHPNVVNNNPKVKDQMKVVFIPVTVSIAALTKGILSLTFRENLLETSAS